MLAAARVAAAPAEPGADRITGGIPTSISPAPRRQRRTHGLRGAETTPTGRTARSGEVARLSQHEASHAGIAVDAARAVRREFETVTSPSYAFMDLRTRTVAEQVIVAHRARDREYDERHDRGSDVAATAAAAGEVQPLRL
ncbi:MAG TPA: DUF922 domain-containing protein [Longimicrobium sp.]|nr:DUF922 domain-containing protein [Longimicrobium sp.]